jgi:hypothetical protein
MLNPRRQPFGVQHAILCGLIGGPSLYVIGFTLVVLVEFIVERLRLLIG